jgi:hypothetical protein
MKNNIKENNLSMDIDTFNKVRGKLKPTDKVSLTDKPEELLTPSVMEDNDIEPEATIEPQDKETIKYLSNVKDDSTGETSKPFVIGDKKYQMVRGITPSKKIIMGVYCYDDVDEEGDNIVHSVDYFDKNIAKPMIEVDDNPEKIKRDFDYSASEKEFYDNEQFMDYLNLVDLVGFKHFFVNIKTGETIAKFKNTKEMIKSGIKLGPNEDYMDVKTLKRFRFGDYFKSDISEDETNSDTDIPKLQSDVKKLTKLIKNKFSMYLSKLDKPIEQAQFLTSMASEIGVPLNKLSSIVTTYKDIAKDGVMDKKTTTGLKAEAKIITKNKLIESLKPKKVVKTIKIKDIR